MIEARISIHVVSGSVNVDDMITALEMCCKHGATLLPLWDMAQSELSQITPDGTLRFIQQAVELGVECKGGRTAVVAPEDLRHGLGSMAETFALFEALSFSMGLFRMREETLVWLFSR
jgi:hypothetical protein